MDAKTLEGMIGDNALTDDAVFDALQELLDDKFDGHGNIIPPSGSDMADIDRLRHLMHTKRPEVLKMMRKFIGDMHYYCCGRGATGHKKCS